MLPYILGGVGLTILGFKLKDYLSDEKNTDDILYTLSKAEKWMCETDKKVLNALGEKQKRPDKNSLNKYLIQRDFYTNLLDKLDKAKEKLDDVKRKKDENYLNFLNGVDEEGKYNSLKFFKDINEDGSFVKFLMDIKEDISIQIQDLEEITTPRKYFVEEAINAKLGLMEIKTKIKNMLIDISRNDFPTMYSFDIVEYTIDSIKEKLIALEPYVAKEDEQK